MRTQPPLNPKSRTDLVATTGENPPVIDGLVKPAYEVAKSITKTSSKVQEPKTYNKARDNLIHGNRWYETVNEELWNLDTHKI